MYDLLAITPQGFDLWKYVLSGGVAWYFFKLRDKEKTKQLEELKNKVDELEKNLSTLNKDYIKEIRAHEAKKAEVAELRKALKRKANSET